MNASVIIVAIIVVALFVVPAIMFSKPKRDKKE